MSRAERGPLVCSAVVVGALGVLALTVLVGFDPLDIAPLVALTVVAAVAYRTLLRWEAQLALLILVILFIPIRRYTLPASLPFALEPYRVLVALIGSAWLSSLLIDPRVRLRRSGFEAPLLLFAVAVAGSVLLNPDRVNAAEDEVTKSLMFLGSYFVLFYIIVSVVRTAQTATLLLKFLVAGGALVAVLAMIENRTSYNVFDHLDGVIPFLQLEELPRLQARGARFRAYASAQHSIALGAALVMLVPLALYLAKTSSRRLWWVCAFLVGAGALATVSRTPVLMGATVVLMMLWLRPRDTLRLWPLMVVSVVVIHFALPTTLGSLKSSFSPEGGLIEEQKSSVGTPGQGRIADLSPALEEYSQRPLFGEGWATRIVRGDRANAQILDNAWLATLLESGIVGAVAWAWLFIRFIRKVGNRAREDLSDRGWLFVALAASAGAYAIGMLTFDSFAFIQVTFLLFILLGLGAALVSSELLPETAATESIPQLEHVTRLRHRPVVVAPSGYERIRALLDEIDQTRRTDANRVAFRRFTATKRQLLRENSHQGKHRQD